MTADLPTVWAGLICFALLAYVVLDGFDLGIGALFPLAKSSKERDTMMNTVAPVWDGNETWLILGGAGLFAAFPLAYSVLLTAFYAPLIAMLLALVLRGVAFEFRFRTERWKGLWSAAFCGGSLLAAFCQGVMVGAFAQGVAVEDRVYAGGWWDWLTPFSLLCGLALLAGYALLGACWLTIKTGGDLNARMARLRFPLALAAVGLLFAVGMATLFLDADIAARWMGPITRRDPGLLIWLIPALTGAASFGLLVTAARRTELPPFLCALALFALAFAGLAASLYPNIIPPAVSYREAANADSSLLFMLVGAAIMIPIILAYTAHAYFVFRGKVDPEHGYH